MMYLRNGKDTVHTVLAFDKKGNPGVYYKTSEDVLGTTQINYTFLQAIPAGVHKSIQTLVNYIS